MKKTQISMHFSYVIVPNYIICIHNNQLFKGNIMKHISNITMVSIFFVGLAFCQTSCKKDPTAPVLTTADVSVITESSASCGGNISSDGGSEVIARGVCWSTSANPTREGSKTTDGSGIGQFTSYITGLDATTTYYVRAYATNSVGTSYGNDVRFTTTEIPIELAELSTSDASQITDIDAIVGGNITSDGNTPVTARGVCWSITENPTIANNKIESGSGIGSFTCTLTGLNATTTYYARAYATNEAGTSYGNQISFTTLAEDIKCIDFDGNSYTFVTIGTQIWMAENLKTTSFRDGTAIIYPGTDNAAWAANTIGAYAWYNNDEATYKDLYGALYNWHAVNSGILCPTGWHVPDETEWTVLTNYIGGLEEGGGKLKEVGTDHWTEPNAGATDEYGFKGLPGGWRRHTGEYGLIGSNSFWWSATAFDATTAWDRHISRATTILYVGNNGVAYEKGRGFSVRCIKD
jgi:uncharacterized protein (TIGR02145 family)